ncbi:MAG: glycosyltransferase family 9 protein [Nitrospinae bacterium]|nr:glycosyltransferase family 9 protein [Nitrospinota bacterium]
MSLLIMRSGALGDTILTFQAARALMAYGETVAVWGRGAWAGLARRFGIDYLAEEAADFDLFYHGENAPEARRALARFDRVFAFKHDPDGSLGAALERIHPRLKLIPPLPPRGYGGSYPAYLLERMDAPPPATFPPLAAPKARDGVVAVAPGSGSEKKNWPVEQYAGLLRRLRGNAEVVLGPAEEDEPRRAEFMALGAIEGVTLLRGAAIETVADKLARAARYVGGDSGVTHLAAALGVPVLALWGQSNPAVWGPLGANARILPAPGGDLARLEVETVARELEMW